MHVAAVGVEVEDRIGDQLTGAVVGDVATAAGLGHGHAHGDEALVRCQDVAAAAVALHAGREHVRVLQELIAVSWHDAEVAKVIRAGIMDWIDLIVGLARAAEEKIGPLGPFSAEEVGAIAASSFIGGESLFLLGLEKKGSPIRASLRRVGDLIRAAEGSSSDKR